MPYIEQGRRNALLEPDPLADFPDTPGELNFLISHLCAQYVKNNGLRYQQINDVLGALEGAKQEFYRRVAVPYEDKKIQENGDVY